MGLDRSVSLTQATIYGIGVILGAGIYALIGVAAGISGTSLWLSFILAAIVASLTAFSYAELSSRFPKEGAESLYATKAFKSALIAFFVAFVFLFSNMFSVAAVSWGFATYAKLFVSISPMIVALVVVIAASIVNFSGIKESVFLNNIFTFVEALGLILIIIFGLPFIGTTDLMSGINGETGFAIIPGIIGGISLVFFAFLGFEGIANIAEEVESAKKIVPKAIIFSLVISTIIYVLVSLVAVSVISPSVLAESSLTGTAINQGPLALVSEVVIGDGFGFWLSIIALFATFNTVLILMIVVSRFIYGLAKQRLLPSFLGKINDKTKTPTNAIVVTAAISMIFVSIGNLEVLGNMTTLGVFLLFFIVNVSLIAVRLKEKRPQNYIALFNFGKIPLSAVLGALFCAIMFLTQYWAPVTIAGFEAPMIVMGLIFFLTAVPVYLFFSKKKNNLTFAN